MSMSAEYFLDTNVLVYAATGTDAERIKRNRALALIQSGNFGVSTQVLQEFYVVATRKVSVPMTPRLALQWIDQLDAYPCVAIDADLVKLGVSISARYQISYWDAAILAAAEVLGATIVYSEDLQHDQTYDRLRVANPFLQGASLES
jgi:predicted nucleic acid-binding protein